MAALRTIALRRARSHDVVNALLNPVVGFPLLWIVGVALAQIELFSFQRGAWSGRAWMVMALVPAAYVLGSLIGNCLWAQRSPAAVAPVEDPRRRRRVLLVLMVIGACELAHQCAVLGTVPLLADNIDTARLALPGGPTVVLLNCLAMAAALAIVLPRRLSLRETRFELLVVVACVILALAAGGRGLAVTAAGVSLLGRTLRWGPPPARVLLAGGALVLAALVVVFFVRTRQNIGNAFEAELYRDVLPDVPAPMRFLVPVHIAIGSNFEALAAVVEHFPDRQPFGNGSFSAVGYDLVIPGATPITAVSEKLTGPFVTVTGAGTLWADGGAWLVTAGMAMIGTLTAAARRAAVVTGRLAFILPAAYLAYLAFFGVYTNLFTQHPDWVVMTPLLAYAGHLLDGGGRPRAGRVRALGYRARDAATARVRATLMRGPLVVVTALVALVALAATGVVLSREPVPPSRTKREPLSVNASAPAVPADATGFATVADVALDNEPLWALTRRSLTVRATPVGMSDTSPAPRAATFKLRRRTTPRTQLDLAGWVGEANALFVMEPSNRGVKVAVYSANTGREVALGRAPEPSQFPGATRQVFVATWDGNTPDLFILDRGARGERARLAVYRGEEIFSRRVLLVQLPLIELSPAIWGVDVGRVGGTKPDLLMLTRRGGSGEPEIHVLSGESAYQSFELQSPIEGVRSLDAEPTVLAGSVGSAPTAFVKRREGWSTVRVGPAVIRQRRDG